MTCAQFRALLGDHLDDGLVVEVREKFDTHKVGCDDCTYFLESYTHTVKVTRLLPRAGPLPAGLEERLRTAVLKALEAAPGERPA